VTRFEYAQFRAKSDAKRGIEFPHTQLTKQNVIAIRHNVRGQTTKQLAESFGVHFRTIEKVRAYETWAHVSENPPGERRAF
jgi:FixJ family two-component response regulator